MTGLRFCGDARLMSAAALLISCLLCSGSEGERMKRVEPSSGEAQFATLRINPAARKLYAGQRRKFDPTKGGL